LEIYHSGQRHYDILKLYLEKGASSRILTANRETSELAKQINLTAAEIGKVEIYCIFTERKIEMEYDSLLLVTERIPNDGLFNSLNGDPERLTNAGIKTLKSIGGSFAPATIATAVYSSHLAAREIQAEPQEEIPFLRERIQI
tara:strand:- start:16 stop:444 length:429 start_codon:yes stop_codon:yes gene_type:complete